jgi:nucleoside-diphosphate-sugar epimerase
MTRGPIKVLITGAGGFIGTHLVRDQLARGRRVVAVDLDLAPLRALELDGALQYETLDIRSGEALAALLEGVDTVFHLAAAHLDVLKAEAWFEQVNVRATGDLARLAAAAGVARFVHCSTVGVYCPLASLPADEDTLPAPDIAYERTKLEGEAAVRQAAAETGLSVIILRPAWVYGPLCPRTEKLVRSIARRRFIRVGAGANLRHPIYISDMLDAFERAATCALPPCETIIVAGRDTVTVRQLVELIIEELGMRYRPWSVPYPVMHAACFILEQAAALAGREPPFSRRSLKFFTESSAFDTARAGRLLGFCPQVTTREGLKRTIQYYREQGILQT